MTSGTHPPKTNIRFPIIVALWRERGRGIPPLNWGLFQVIVSERFYFNWKPAIYLFPFTAFYCKNKKIEASNMPVTIQAFSEIFHVKLTMSDEVDLPMWRIQRSPNLHPLIPPKMISLGFEPSASVQPTAECDSREGGEVPKQDGISHWSWFEL